MKKLLYTLLVCSASFISACETENVSKLTEGVKVITKCCQNLSKGKTGAGLNGEEAESNLKVSSTLPAYFWDTKMMIR